MTDVQPQDDPAQPTDVQPEQEIEPCSVYDPNFFSPECRDQIYLDAGETHLEHFDYAIAQWFNSGVPRFFWEGFEMSFLTLYAFVYVVIEQFIEGHPNVLPSEGIPD